MKGNVIIIFLLLFAVLLFFGCNQPPANPVSVSDFASCLASKGVVMYGAIGCAHCNSQKQLFGGSWSDVNYIECSVSNNPNLQNVLCSSAGITGYPTWVFSDGQRIQGEVSFDQLSQKTNCLVPNVQSQPIVLDLNNEVNITNNPSLEFDVLETIPSASVGEQYNYSFCKPDLTSTSDLCGGIDSTTNPTGGNPPYHFVLDSGAFLPMGLNLNPNGLITGTPTTASGSPTQFKVCAVDNSGTQICQSFELTVNGTSSKPEIWAGTMTGNYVVDNYCGIAYSKGIFSYSFNVTIKLMSICAAKNSDGELYDCVAQQEADNTGTVDESTTVAQQIQHDSDFPYCYLTGGSVHETVLLTHPSWETTIKKFSLDSSTENNYLIAGTFQLGNDSINIEPSKWGGLELTVTSSSDNTISGTWGTSQYGEHMAHGTFTLNKQ
ncbi:MAG: Ig domain-containing protein [Candidatus Diapherotrites archaeon]|nr:Ig domain-containing protein [Candidatus Diapherotrites archaeon]